MGCFLVEFLQWKISGFCQLFVPNRIWLWSFTENLRMINCHTIFWDWVALFDASNVSPIPRSYSLDVLEHIPPVPSVYVGVWLGEREDRLKTSSFCLHIFSGASKFIVSFPNCETELQEMNLADVSLIGVSDVSVACEISQEQHTKF